MKLKRKLFRKALSFFAAFLIILQSVSPALPILATDVFAQEVPSPAPTTDPAPSTAPDSSPTPTIEPSPQDSASPSPTAQPSAEPSASPAPSADSSPNPQSNDQNGKTQDQTTQNNQSASPPASPSPKPEIKGDKHVSVNLVTEPASPPPLTDPFDQLYAEPSATLSTNKADYSPTESAVISGSGFSANTAYNLVITSQDPPAVNFSTPVTTNDQGTFTYTYQLDGNYRPNYKVEVKDSTGTAVATTTFTDSVSASIDLYSQCSNDQGTGYTTADQWCRWTNGDLNNSNSRYFEGDATPQRLAIEDLTTGDHTVTIQYDTTKGGKHAYDFIANDKFSENWITNSDMCDSPISNLANCSSLTANDSSVVPADSNAAGHDTGAGTSRHFRIRNGSWVSGGILSGPTLVSGTYAGDSSTNIQLKFHVDTSSCANKYNAGTHNNPVDACEVLITFGTHVSTQADWGVGNSAANIQGSPYHVRAIELDGSSIGNRDNQMAANAVILPTTITVNKVLSPSNDSGLFNLRIDGSTAGTGGNVGNGGTTGAITVSTSGTHTVSEIAGTGTSLSNYTTTYSCSNNLSGSGTSVPAFSVTAGQNVVCTFTNTRNTGTITVNKTLSPVNDPGKFNLQIDGTNKATDQGNNGTTGQVSVLSSGTHTVSEIAGTGTSITNYTSSYACLDGTSPVASGSGITSSAFSVASGHNIICTFTNTRKTGTVTIVKSLSPANDTGTFNLQINGTTYGTGGDTATTGAQAVNTGSVTVGETGANGTNLTNYVSSISCKNAQNQTVSSPTFTLNSGDNIICTITNTRNAGSVKVNKLADADGNGTFETINPGTFTWSLNGTGTNAMGSTVSGVSTGSYPVNENTVSDYHLVGWYPGGTGSTQYSCTNLPQGAQYTTLPASVSVSASATTEITLCNAHDTGTIIVHKDVQNPDGNSVTDTSATFKVKLDGANEQNIQDGGTVSYSGITTGSHNVTESVIPSDYSIYGISTTPGTSGNTSGLSVTVVSGQPTDVYVTNKQKKASITVVKVVKNAGGNVTSDPQTFTIQLNGANDDATLADNHNVIYTINPGGPYAISEIGVDTSKYTSLGCKLDTDANADNINLGSNGSITVTCTNQQVGGTISGVKFQSDNSTPIAGWGINLYSCSAGDFLNCGFLLGVNTNASGFFSFTNLVTGFYQVREFIDSLFTPVGATIHNVTINPGTTSTGNNFSNFKNINLTVCKKSDADGNLQTTNDQAFVQGWGMTLYSGENQLISQATNSDGCYTFQNLGPNANYNVREEIRSGWSPLSDPNSTFDFGVPKDGVPQNHTFINVHEGTIVVRKVMVGGTDSFTFTGSVGGTISQNNGSLTGLNVLPGTYTSVEGAKTGWDLTGISCDDTNSTGNIETKTATFNVGAGETVTCTFTNTQRGSIGGQKFNDENGDGSNNCIINTDFLSTDNNVRFGCDPGLSGWHIGLFTDDEGSPGTQVGQDAQTNDSGNYSFGNIIPGSYWVCEVNQPGWAQTAPKPGDNAETIKDHGVCYRITLGAGQNITGQDFGNQFIPPVLNISKDNNRIGQDLNPGSDVVYTLTLTVSENSVNGVKVKDLLPGGIKYRAGSWSATKNDLPFPVSEPTYASPGTWDLGNLSAGDKVVMTLTADINSSQQPGLYKDVAWAQGSALDSSTVLASAVSPGIVGTNFVGTEVNVIKDNQNTASVNVENKTEGQVLGASTSQLPETGASTIWVVLASSGLIFGLFIMVLGYKTRRKRD